MSGYFTNLVERAIGPGPAVEPRLGSTFEPAAAGFAVPEAIEDDSQREATRERSAASRDDERGPRRPQIQLEEMEGAERAVERKVEEEATLLPRRSLAPKRPISQPRPTRAASPQQTPVQQTAGRSQPPEPHPLPINGQGLDRETAVSSDAIPATGQQARPAPPTPASLPAAAASPLATAANPARNPASQPPLVRVNIGRIEVRANVIAPPAASRPPVAARPKLSLQEYLQSRSGGGR